MTVHITTPARLGETRLPDGRLLGWAEWGPQEGTPVLLCPGAATSRRLGFGPRARAPPGNPLGAGPPPPPGARPAPPPPPHTPE
ncbi:alpha/beta hydrolase, partial [Streptomyces sp. NPDC059409]